MQRVYCQGFQIQVVGLSSEMKSVMLMGEYRRRTRMIANITTSFANGKAEGILEKFGGKEVTIYCDF